MAHYWDNISLDSSDENRLSFVLTCLLLENQLMTSNEVLEKEKDLKDFAAKYKAGQITFANTLRASDLLLLSLRLTDFFLKAIGAALVDAYVYTRNRMKTSSGGSKVFWGVATFFTGLFNALIAQPLFFIANTILHARALVDGVLSFVVGGFARVGAAVLGCFNSTKRLANTLSEWSVNTVISGLKCMGRNILNLLGDAVIGGVAYGLSMLCALIPGAQVAVPFISAHATVAQAAVGNLVLSATEVAGVAISVAASSSLSAAVQSGVRASSSRIYKGLNVFGGSLNGENKEAFLQNAQATAQEDDIKASLYDRRDSYVPPNPVVAETSEANKPEAAETSQASKPTDLKPKESIDEGVFGLIFRDSHFDTLPGNSSRNLNTADSKGLSR